MLLLLKNTNGGGTSPWPGGIDKEPLIWAETDFDEGDDMTLVSGKISAIGKSGTTQLVQSSDAIRFTLTNQEAINNGSRSSRMTASVTVGTFSEFMVISNFLNSSTRFLAEHGNTDTDDDAHYPGVRSSSTVFLASVKRGGTRSAISCNNSSAIMSTLAGASDSLWQHSFGGTQASHRVYLNGSEEPTTPTVVGDPGTGSATKTLTFAAREAGAFLSGINWKLYLLYTPQLSASEEASVESYINSKYSIF